MSEIRLVFMGTPYFAVPSLKALIESTYKVVGVVTAPDKPAGRGRKLRLSDVKIEAQKHNIPILQPHNLKSDTFLEELKSLQANLFIVVAFRMLPKNVWQMPQFGTFNLHASLLPNYRGAAPINWALINGETKTGVTTFFIDDKIDTGAIIFQEEVAISPEENAGCLHDKLMICGSFLILKTVEAIATNKTKTSLQNSVDLKPAPKLNPDNCKIDWCLDFTDIFNKIRGLSPYPAAWCYLSHNNNQTKLKIYKASKIEQDHTQNFGSITVTKNTLTVACKNGFIAIKELQLAGKKRLFIKDFLNGMNLTSSDKLL